MCYDFFAFAFAIKVFFRVIIVSDKLNKGGLAG